VHKSLDRRLVPAPAARRHGRLWPRAQATALLLFFGAFASAITGAHAARAYPSRTFSLSDSGRLHLTSKHKFTLNEQGSASGTISGPIYIHLNIVSTNHVTAEVNIYPGGGSITGSASANYRSAGSAATFNGTMYIVRGSGSYSHARGSGLSFTGTIQRINDNVTVHVSGRMSA